MATTDNDTTVPQEPDPTAVNPALAPQQIPTTSPLADFFKTLQNAATGAASGRKTAADLNVQREQLLNQQYGQGSTNALNQAKFGLDAPGQNAGNAVRGDILANSQDASFSGLPPWLQSQIPTTTGGLRPSTFSANTRALGANMSRDALAASNAGPMTVKYPTAPTIEPIPDASLLESIAGNVGTGGSIASAALKALSGGGGSGGGSGGSSGGNLGNLIDMLKNLKGKGSIDTPEYGTGVLNQPGYTGGPSLPSGPPDPYAGLDQTTYQELFGSVDPNASSSSMTPEQLQEYLFGPGTPDPSQGGNEWDYGPDPSTSDWGGS